MNVSLAAYSTLDVINVVTHAIDQAHPPRVERVNRNMSAESVRCTHTHTSTMTSHESVNSFAALEEHSSALQRMWGVTF